MRSKRLCHLPYGKSAWIYAPALAAAAAAMIFYACTAQNVAMAQPEPALAYPAAEQGGGRIKVPDSQEKEKIINMLDEIAELERSGIYFKGMGFRESSLNQNIGDYSAATAALFKELLWTYGHGQLEKKEVQKAVDHMLEYEGPGKNDVVYTAQAAKDFFNGNWPEAQKKLTLIFSGFIEPDSFVNWMILSCILETDSGSREAISAYRSIRARYSQFPEYWYRGAKLFNGMIASEFAEYCINLAPNGPYANDCRGLIAVSMGLKAEDGISLKSKTEVEGIITQAVNNGNPMLLEPLMPLIGLPENPYTIYALGALKPLGVLPAFRDYFEGLAVKAKGRLADRLVYICRG